jgi:hypothetical protein
VFLFFNASGEPRPLAADDVRVGDADQAGTSSTPSDIPVVETFRSTCVWLVLASSIIAVVFAIGLRVRVDPEGAAALDWVIAVLLLVSRMWWQRKGHIRIADACGVVAIASLGGMACGAIAMLELRLGFPVADGMLRSMDNALGVDGIAIVEALVRQGHWIFAIMAPAYNFTVPIFFVSLVALSLIGDRVEAWRGAMCFVGTLLTTCLIATFAPAKGLGVWASDSLFARLPPRAMRTFWPHFDEFYFGDDPVLRLQVIDGVISFPSFHAIVGLLTATMWRKRTITFVPALIYLGFMLLSIFPGGGHYFVDMLGGVVVWAVWFAWSCHVERQVARPFAPAHA